MIEGAFTAFLGAADDVAHTALGQTQRIRNGLLLVALLMHFPGALPAIFSPILDFGLICGLICGFHSPFLPQIFTNMKYLISESWNVGFLLL